MEDYAIVRLFTLKKLSAKGAMAELDGTHGQKVFSLSAVKKWRKRFAHGRITLEDDPKSGKPPQNDLCESLGAPIEQSPCITCKCMCKKLRIAKTTCLRVLHEHCWFRNLYFRLVSHSMTEKQAQRHDTFAEKQALSSRETSCDKLVTVDQSRFYYKDVHDST
jgi:hypothetical protein